MVRPLRGPKGQRRTETHRQLDVARRLARPSAQGQGKRTRAGLGPGQREEAAGRRFGGPRHQGPVLGGPHHEPQALGLALLQMLVDVGPAVGHHHPARARRRAPDGPQALGPQGRLAHAALAGAGAAVGGAFSAAGTGSRT